MHVAGLKDLPDNRRPHPAVGDSSGPAAVMIRQPPPGIVTHPGVAEAVVPAPAALLEGRPIARHRGLPDRPEIGSLDPLSRGVQILEAVTLADARRRRWLFQDLIALFAPPVQLDRPDGAVHDELRRIGGLHPDGLALVQI